MSLIGHLSPVALLSSASTSGHFITSALLTHSLQTSTSLPSSILIPNKVPIFFRFSMRINKKSPVTKMSNMKEKRTPVKNEVISFCGGSLVEVTTDEEGYKGAWFMAKIVTLLSPPAGRSRKRKKGGTFVVEYLKLVEENGSRPLTETIAGKQLRPFPPVVDEPFEMHDVVDAYLNDGWWEGIVVEVLEESKRFSVSFESPSPHVMEFYKDELRHHLNWDGCKWFRSCKKAYNSYDQDDQRQNQLTTPPNSAISLEVVLSGESLMSSEITGGMALNGCKKMKTTGTYAPPSSTELSSDMQPCVKFKESVLGNIFESSSDAQQSRPATKWFEDMTPAKDEHPSNIGILPWRIANFSSWEAFSRKGEHNTFRAKALEGYEKDAVTDERMRKMMSCPISSFDSNPAADIRELDLPDISNDLGSLHSKDEAAGASVGIMMQAQPSKLDEMTRPAIVCISDCQRQKALAALSNTISTLDVISPTGSFISATNTMAESSSQKDHEDSHSETQMEPYIANSTCTDLTLISKTDVRPFNVNKLISGNIYTPLLYIKPSSIVLPSETGALFAEILQNQIQLWHRPLMIVEKPSNSDVSSERHDEIAQKSTDIVVYCGKEKTSFLSLENTPLKALSCSQNSSGLELLDISGEGYSSKDGTLEMAVATCSSGSNPLPSSDILELDLLDIISSPLFLQRTDETARSLVDTSHQTFSFCKKSSLWKNIEQMKEFHAFPQNPHFRPLQHYKDSHREAMAIACTVIFAGLVDEMLELVADVPKSNIDKIMKDILPFKNLGFNIVPIKDRLTELQRVKEEREQLLQASAEAKSKIEEQAQAVEETSAKLENAVKELRESEEKVAKLKEEVANLRATKEEQVSEMTARRSKDESIEQGILQNETDFQNILSDPNLTAIISDFAVN